MESFHQTHSSQTNEIKENKHLFLSLYVSLENIFKAALLRPEFVFGKPNIVLLAKTTNTSPHYQHLMMVSRSSPVKECH